MSLDQVGLKIVINTGNKAQAALAAKVLPLRENGNLVLISLILAETVVNMSIPLLIESFPLGEAAAIVASALLVLVFAEIIPISACARNALYVGAKLAWLVHAVKFVLFPIGYPFARLIDLVLGEELPTIYNRSQLKGLLDIHAFDGGGMGGLGEKEVQIMKSALELGEMNVTQVMTKIQDAKLLATDAIIDATTMHEVLMKRALDRVAVVDRSTGDVACFLLTKNLFFHKNKRISEVLNEPKVSRTCLFIPAETKLVDCLHEFERGHIHMALIYSIDNPHASPDSHASSDSKPSLQDHMHPEFGHIRVSLNKAIQSRIQARQHDAVPSFPTPHALESSAASAESNNMISSEPQVSVVGIVTLNDVMTWLLKTSAFAPQQQWNPNNTPGITITPASYTSAVEANAPLRQSRISP
eukprot:c11635_g1_i2.p1 GENE.c11635_g1_i2~~c11635_g1_i2.p1  ORF type:complete len:414 (+),score=97.00 c11635_g1_i2:258-1499(+)